MTVLPRRRGPLNNAYDGAVRLANCCFRPLNRGIGDKLDKFRLIYRRLASGSRANGGIYGILTAIGTRQRRERQNTPVVKRRQRVDRHHRKLVTCQRPGFVRTENIDAAGFIDGRQARRQNTFCARQSAGADRRCEALNIDGNATGNRRQHCLQGRGE